MSQRLVRTVAPQSFSFSFARRSASFSAMGVAVSPGRSVMAALAAVDAAVSSSTVSCFSASASMDA